MRAPHFALFILQYLVILYQPSNSRVLFRRPGAYNTFMKQVTINYEKAKVETLGDIFKRHVQQLRHTPNKRVELVFLIDSSGTVGRSYFYEEVRFVRYLLSDFTVDINTTRVSVITFSSPNKIYRYIDYLSEPELDNHKCKLLAEDIPQVDYTPGGTHTLGAFLEAEKVLKSARPDAVKAIFLMTDGYSNGGDPRPVAKKLKREGVKIFTFGIRDGFVWELQDMASEPKNETCYILDSFEEFEALAKRALHADLQTGSYVEQSQDKCRKLCNTESLCCNENATCSCGTYTGKYECLCKPGYYGTGRGKTGCKACPPGTYKNFTGLGDTNTCAPCPDEHQTTPQGAVSITQCICKRGYRSFGYRSCTVFRCPELSPPKNGYFVNNKCNNVFNAACGLRCQHGYELRGSSLRICQDDGTWSGQNAECIMKTCPSLPPPKNGHMICSSDDFSYSTVCRFTCNAGYQLVGSRKRTCLAIAYWTGIATICREITCPPLVEIKDGVITPYSCTQKEVVFGTTCYISCLSDYTLKGPHNKQCTPEGTWLASGTGVNQCVDETPPVLQCPDNIEIEANELEATTEVFWPIPVPVDNSGFRPVLTSDPATTPGAKLPIGTTLIIYKAEDLSQNVATCKFLINIIDKTPPRVDKCKSPPPFISTQDRTEVAFEPPSFSDNSDFPVEIVSSFKRGELFPVGSTPVTFTAFDNANNNKSCTIEITVIRHRCVTPNPPAHGNVTCKEGEIGVLCHIACFKGFAFAVPPAEDYFCAYEDGRWLPMENYPFPDCAEIQISNEIQQPATITLTGDLSCNDKALISRIQQNLEGKMEDKLSNVCENEINCSVGSLKAVCEDEEDFNKIQLLPDKLRKKRLIAISSEQSRQKRSAKKKSKLSFEIVLEGSVRNDWSFADSINKSSPLMNMLAALQQEANEGFLDMTVDDHKLELSQITYDPDQLSYKCPKGSVVMNDTCVNCPVGTFYEIEKSTCQECPVGMYQPEEGQISCMSCPQNKSTEKENSKSELDCKAFCVPGSFSSNGLEPCETCNLGFYQQNYSSYSCSPCPHGKTTLRRGSKKLEDCIVFCQPGYISKDGLTPCLPCPLNTYQNKQGQTECVYCPFESGTAMNGSTSFEDCIYNLEALEIQSDGAAKGVKGQQQVLFSYSCADDPCENGGTCLYSKTIPYYKCVCLPGFTGTNCDSKIDYCLSAPCSNGGICIARAGGYTCSCKAGFAGVNCENNIDECASSPCMSKGICIDKINGFSCNCPLPYTGPTCNSVISNCADVSCLNGGVCVNIQSSFKCNCPPGFTGVTCEIDIDECISVPCRNDGTCQDLRNDYKCQCMPGFTGKNCDTQIDECADAPCQNDGTCEDLLNGYRCHCTTAFTGHKCEKALTSQYQLDFVSSSIMDYAELTIDQPLTAVTASFWIKSSDVNHGGTPFSYAVKDNFNAFTVTRLEGLTLSINSEDRVMNTQVNDGMWHHVVFTWSYNRGNWKSFVDGILKDEGFDLSTQKPIPGKGIFIVGQEQDTFGGGFSPGETLNGTLSHLNVWDQEFTSADVERLRLNCDSFEGNIISWSAVQAALKGNVGVSPSGFCQDCPQPVQPLNGIVRYTDTKVGSTVEFECDKGYSLTSAGTLKCLISRNYDNDNKFPECEVINCGTPRTIPNGKMKGKDFTYGKRVMLECNFGYYNNGGTYRECDEFGEWTPEISCSVKKCTLPLVSPSTVPSTTKQQFNPKEIVKFSCKSGSFLQTRHDSVTCELGGSWDKSVPSCDPIKCTLPPNITSGRLLNLLNEYNIGDVARYQCNTGHEFSKIGDNNKDTVACLLTGNWETILPQCLPITCPDPPPIYNAVTVGDDRTYQSLVSYVCLPGYLPTGKNIIECEASKDWSGLKFSCTPIDCKAPPPLKNGAVTGSAYFYGSVVTYQCYQGYLLNGNDQRKCQENASWSGPEPTCNPVSCGNLFPVTNGTVSYTDVTYQSTAKYTCDKGFELIGADEITCEASTNWEPAPPICELRSCPAPQDISFGTYTVSGPLKYEAALTYMCNIGYQLDGTSAMSCQEDGTWSSPPPVCLLIQCPVLSNITNGFVTLTGMTYSSTATYTCQTNHLLVGVNSRTCQSNGTWSQQEPVCQPTTCPAPDNIANGLREYKDLSIGSIVSYKCDKGFKLEGDIVRRCQPNLTFSGPEPTCKPVQCPPLGNLIDGVITLSSLVYTSTASFICNEGFTLTGSASVRCEANELWSSSKPTCVPVVCTVSPVINGRANITTALYGSVVGYECNPGYKVVGSASRKCLGNGSWDAPVPTCEVIRCPTLSLLNGKISSSQRTVGTVVTFECNDKYYLTGPTNRTCESGGEWSGGKAHCSPILCPKAVQIEHGDFDAINLTTLEYKCDRGYTLQGSSLLTCGTDGVWRPAAPFCEINTCADLTLVPFDYGTVVMLSNKFGDSAMYSCDTGYSLHGVTERECDEHGQWTEDAPYCEIISCGSPIRPRHGDVVGQDFNYNSVVKLECENGYKLNGTDSIKCLSDGLWERYNTTCDLIECPMLSSNIPDGTISVSNYTINGVAVYQCDQGYHLTGSNKRVCLETGHWSESTPVCSRVHCMDPYPIPHAILEGDSRDYGAEILYTCEVGYYLQGSFSRICQQDGQWSNSPPDCVEVVCPEPGTPPPYFNLDSANYLSNMTYYCDDGYEIVGATVVFCQSNGQWSDMTPSCTKISCGEPPMIQDAVIIQRTGTLFEDIIQYSCIEGYSPSGQDTSSCLADKSWSSSGFTCTIVSCPTISQSHVPNSNIQAQNFTFGSLVSFTCFEGYTMSGGADVLCTADGKWNQSYPACIIVQCPPLGNIDNGVVVSSSLDYGSTVQFSCNTGYIMTGSNESHCLSSGAWSFNNPVCNIVSCGPLPGSILNGALLSAQPEYVFQQRATYVCDYGYDVVGNSTLTCTEMGIFDVAVPSCSRTPCPPPDSVDFGSLTEFKNNFTLVYSCFSGYELNGLSELSCLLGGIWSGQTPTCLPVTCPIPITPQHGVIEGSEFTFQKVIKFSCEEGYYLQGGSELACLANQSWSPSYPVCLPVDCGAPTEKFENGFVNGTYTYGGSIEYHCNPGFQLQNNKFRSCQANRKWEDSVPQCIRLSCAVPPSIANGYFTGDIYLFEANITYFCNAGYQLSGIAMRTCQSDLTWSGQSPSCLRISCGVPPVVINGKTTGDSHLYLDQVNVTCDFGYRLTGVISRTCESSGNWSGEVQCDQILCPEPPIIQHSQYRYTTNSGLPAVLSAVKYECDTGYIINGTGEIVCEESGQWSSNSISCYPVSCSPMTTLEHGVVTGSDFTYLSVVKFACDLGFELIGKVTLACGHSGVWSDPIPYCKVISCSPINVEHGATILNLTDASSVTSNRNGSVYIYGDKVTFVCNEGHESHDNITSSYCRADGTWTMPNFTCTPVTCPEPVGIEHAVLTGSSRTYKSVLTASCVLGYDLIGEDELTCGADGNWVEIFPKCVLLACGSPPTVNNALIDGDSFKVGDFISYRCKSGYEIEGNTMVQCGNETNWVGNLPVCKEVDCGPLPTFQSGLVTAVSITYKSQAQLNCLAGYVQQGDPDIVCGADRTWSFNQNLHCAPIDCRAPLIIDHGTVFVENTTLGNLATYSCDKGYYLKDSSSLICAEDGSWVYDLPQCLPVDCLQPVKVPNSKATLNGTHYLDMVKYTCDEGYKLAGDNDELTCGETEQWLGDVPICEAMNCGWPPEMANAYYSLDNNRTDYLSLAFYQCLPGYESSDTDVYMNCTSSGQWVGQSIECTPLDCSQLPSLSHGEYIPTNGTKYGALVSFDCAKGYKQSGKGYIACTEAGTWSTDYHACLPVDCGEPPKIVNGIVESNETTYASSALYSCLPGYSIVGNETVDCSEAGSWSSALPLCEPVDCRAPTAIAHGHVSYTSTTFQSLAIYSCNQGYIISDANILICSEFASWEGKQPFCSIVNCTEPLIKSNMRVQYYSLSYTSSAKFNCDPGYELLGQSSITCLETGQWSEQSPDCAPLKCSKPSQISDGTLLATGTSFGDSIYYSCDRGYNLRGDAVIFCNELGQWNGSSPKCEIVDCGKPPRLSNGEAIYISTTYSSVATYVCSKRYRLQGNDTVYCDGAGNWVQSNPAVCEVVTCPEPGPVADGQSQYTSLTVGSTVIYTCNAGFKLTNSGVLTCNDDGHWTGVTPQCHKILCSTPPVIPNGHHSNANTSVGVRVQYSCSTGFVHKTVNYVECLVNGTWSSELPLCEPITCPEIPEVLNAVVTPLSGNTLGSKVTYTCLKGYEMGGGLDNEMTITCTSSGQWSGPAPRCTVVTCKNPPPGIVNGIAVTSGSTYTSEAHFICQPGYQLKGSGKVTCNHLGQWSTDDPSSCVPVSCGQPPGYPLSSFVGSIFTFNQTVMYSCSPGYALIGSSISHCGSDGNWTPVNFNCQILQCEELIAIPENGYLVGKAAGPYSVGTVISFKCSEGFTLVGHSDIICTLTGHWSTPPPLCENIIDLCKETLAMDNIAPPPPGKFIGDKISIDCSPGYVASGNMTSVCQRDGSWTLPSGTCKKIFCDRPVVDDPQTVKLIGQQYYFGDKVTFFCRPGYVPISDTSVLTCRENGQWDGEAKCFAFCKQDCLNGGKCIGSNKCKCLPGWTGVRCERALCILPCLHGGHCIAPYKCRCKEGYEGSRCEKVVCAKGCQNGGRCVQYNKCQCPFNFTGPSCEIPMIDAKQNRIG